MSITDKQRDEMLEAAKPLMKWLAENFNPHMMAIVHAADIELLEGIATSGTLEYVDDSNHEGGYTRLPDGKPNLRVVDGDVEAAQAAFEPAGSSVKPLLSTTLPASIIGR